MHTTQLQFHIERYRQLLMARKLRDAVLYRAGLLHLLNHGSSQWSADVITRDALIHHYSLQTEPAVNAKDINVIRGAYGLAELSSPYDLAVSSVINPYFRREDSPSTLTLSDLSTNSLGDIVSKRNKILASLVSGKNILLVGPCQINEGLIHDLLRSGLYSAVAFFSLFSTSEVRVLDRFRDSITVLSYLNGVKVNSLETLCESYSNNDIARGRVFFQTRRWSWLNLSRRVRPIYICDLPFSRNGALQLTNLLHDICRFNFKRLDVLGCDMYSRAVLYSQDYLGYSRPSLSSYASSRNQLINRLLFLHDPLSDFRFARLLAGSDPRISFLKNSINPCVLDDFEYLERIFV